MRVSLFKALLVGGIESSFSLGGVDSTKPHHPYIGRGSSRCTVRDRFLVFMAS